MANGNLSKKIMVAVNSEILKLDILKRLRNETSERHAGLEQRLPVVEPRLSRDDYRAILEGFFGYYAPPEKQKQLSR